MSRGKVEAFFSSGTAKVEDADAMSEEAPAVPARIVVADDHPLVREAVRMMLGGQPDLKVVGEAKDGQEALELCRRLEPDLVLMDVRMPKMDGLEATRKIKEECPATIVLMMTSFENPQYLSEAIRAGAAGYVLKDITEHQLLEAVRRAIEGESPLNQELAMQLFQRLLIREADRRQTEPVTSPPPEATANKERQEPPPKPLTELLTPRELEVIRLLAVGKTNQQIARELYISLSTVKRNVEHIILKFGVSDRTQAAVKAIELGLLSEANGGSSNS